MARQSREAALRQAKDAKQKKLLFLLVPVFLGLLVWQGPKTLKAFSGSSAPPPPAATTTTATTTTGTGTTPATSAPPVAEGPGLNETDPLLDPLEGQLVSFSQFESKDPFGGLDGAGESSGTTTTTDGSGGTDATGARAVIEVNGASEDVGLDEEFPAGDPAFRLVSVDGQTVRIGLVSGSFSTGSETISIDVGETFILVSESDGKRYVLRLVSVATGS